MKTSLKLYNLKARNEHIIAVCLNLSCDIYLRVASFNFKLPGQEKQQQQKNLFFFFMYTYIGTTLVTGLSCTGLSSTYPHMMYECKITKPSHFTFLSTQIIIYTRNLFTT